MIIVKQVSPEVWKDMSQAAHEAVFNETWQPELETIDFALLMVDDTKDQVISYSTVQRIDSKTVYIQYGGAFKAFRGTPIVYESFCKMLEYLKSKYEKILTLVENINYPMLNFYMKQKFLITGVRFFKDHLFLENSYGT